MLLIHEYFLFTLQKYLNHLNLFDLSLRFNGFPIKEATRQLKMIQGKNELDFNTYIEQKKQSIVNYHLQHNDFYKLFVKSKKVTDWNEIPIMTKRDLQQPLEMLLSSGYRKSNVYIDKTSGASGHPFIFAKDKFCHALTWAIIINRFSWFDINFNTSKQARFYGIPKDKKGAPPFSIDDNIFHTSTEGKVLENPRNSAPEFIFQRSVSPEKAPNKPSFVTINFANGDPFGINGKKLSPAKLLEKLNQLAGKNGIGRVDLVENRFIGIKSRGVYETPGGTLLMHSHRAIESVTLDKETMHKKDEVMPRYAELIYNGYWYSKERFKLQKIVDLKKNKVNGSVKLKLYKGNITIESRQTKSSAYSMKKVSFEENKTFNKSNVERFINFHKKKLRS